MENICIRCGSFFDTESWNMDLCQKCESDLAKFENDDQPDVLYEESLEWSSEEEEDDF